MEDTSLIYGRNAVIEAIKSGRGLDSVLITENELKGSLVQIAALCRDNKIVLKRINPKKLDVLCDNGVHQGVAAYISIVTYKELDDVLDFAKSKGESPFIIVCDGICDPHNLGAIIRTSEAAGAHGVVIPKRGGVQITSATEKAAAGALSYQNIIRVTNISNTLDELKTKRLWIYGADMNGEDYKTVDFTGSAVLVLGSEGKGLSRLVKEKCDFLMKIPMRGKINSLNVSVASGILMYAYAYIGVRN